MERPPIRAGRPLTEAEAQDYADRTIAVLGGKITDQWLLTIAAHSSLRQADGEMRPATEIEDLDTVKLESPPVSKPLIARVLSADAAAGTIELGLNDGSEGRLEMELELMNLERGE